MGEEQDYPLKEHPDAQSQKPEEDLGTLLDGCGHYFAHRIGCSRRGSGSVLALLVQKPGITQKALAEIMGVQPASVSELLQKLERKGLVRREKDGQDRRSVRVTLTEAGQQHQSQSMKERTAPFQALSPEEQDTLARLLKKLLRDWKQRYPVERGRQGNAHRNRHNDHRHEEQTEHMEELYESDKE